MNCPLCNNELIFYVGDAYNNYYCGEPLHLSHYIYYEYHNTTNTHITMKIKNYRIINYINRSTISRLDNYYDNNVYSNILICPIINPNKEEVLLDKIETMLLFM